MGGKGSRLTEQRLVPFEAARHIATPMIVHIHFIRSPCGLILVLTDLDTTGHGPAKTKSLQPGRQPAVFTPLPAYPRNRFTDLCRQAGQAKLILPSPETHPAE